MRLFRMRELSAQMISFLLKYFFFSFTVFYNETLEDLVLSGAIDL